MSSASTRRNSKPGVMKSSVRPASGRAARRASRARGRSSCRRRARARRRVIRCHAVGLDGVALAVDDVLLERGFGDGRNVSRPTWSVTRSTSRAGEQLRREVQAGGRRRGRAGVARVDRLVAPGIGERLGDVRRQRRLAVRLAVEPQPPAAFAEMLEQLDRAVARARPSAAASDAPAPPRGRRRCARAAAPRRAASRSGSAPARRACR